VEKEKPNEEKIIRRRRELLNAESKKID
jgi:hypothetical protein